MTLLENHTCKECEYFNEMPTDVNNIGKMMYVCLRYPPTLTSFTAPAPGGQISVSMQSNYPMIMKNSAACGEILIKAALLQ